MIAMRDHRIPRVVSLPPSPCVISAGERRPSIISEDDQVELDEIERLLLHAAHIVDAAYERELEDLDEEQQIPSQDSEGQHGQQGRSAPRIHFDGDDSSPNDTASDNLMSSTARSVSSQEEVHAPKRGMARTLSRFLLELLSESDVSTLIVDPNKDTCDDTRDSSMVSSSTTENGGEQHGRQVPKKSIDSLRSGGGALTSTEQNSSNTQGNGVTRPSWNFKEISQKISKAHRAEFMVYLTTQLNSALQSKEVVVDRRASDLPSEYRERCDSYYDGLYDEHEHEEREMRRQRRHKGGPRGGGLSSVSEAGRESMDGEEAENRESMAARASTVSEGQRSSTGNTSSRISATESLGMFEGEGGEGLVFGRQSFESQGNGGGDGEGGKRKRDTLLERIQKRKEAVKARRREEAERDARRLCRQSEDGYSA